MALDRERILGGLKDKHFWKELIVLEGVGSTNDVLRELAESEAPEGTVVIAESQTAGRGRFGRSWQSPQGGAWFSILLRPPISATSAGCVSVLLAVAIAQSLRGWLQLPVGVKWPNDLFLENKKLGGILIELITKGDKIEALIAGIGINVNNSAAPDARVVPISLKQVLGHVILLEEFFAVVLDGIADSYKCFLLQGFEPVLKWWRQLSVLGDLVEVHRSGRVFTAKVVDLSERGELLVETPEGIEALVGEEVTLGAIVRSESVGSHSSTGRSVGR